MPDFIHIGYNTSLALANGMLFGALAASVGLFLILRRQALISDVLSHATLPGLAAGFIWAWMLDIDSGRVVISVLTGGMIAAGLCLAMLRWLKTNSTLPEDASLGLILSVWFGLGVMGLSVVQTLENAQSAGLSLYLLGAASAVTLDDVIVNASIASVVFALLILIYKRLYCHTFDGNFSVAHFGSHKLTERVFLFCVLATTIAGLKTVGLVLVVGLMLIPPTIARLWVTQFIPVLALSIIIACGGVLVGIATSAQVENVPSGPAIVTTLCALLILSVAGKQITGLGSKIMLIFSRQ